MRLKMRHMQTFLIGFALLVSLPVFRGSVFAQESEPGQESEPVRGTIAGHVSILPDAGVSGAPQVVLMSSGWAELWNGDVQQRIDRYFNLYRGAVAQDPALFDEIAAMARRDAVVSLVSQMQQALGLQFKDHVREVSPDGRFEFTGVPLGEHKVVVLAEAGKGSLIWAETVNVRSSIPQFIEVQNRIQ